MIDGGTLHEALVCDARATRKECGVDVRNEREMRCVFVCSLSIAYKIQLTIKDEVV
jgi:hypothetical protein